MYGDILKKSWNDLWKNLNLFIPYILQIIIWVLLILIGVLSYFLIGLIGTIIIGIILFLIGLYFSFRFSACLFDMIKNVANNKKAMFNNSYKITGKYVWRILGLSLLICLIVFVPLTILALIAIGLFFVNKILGIVIGIILFILFVIYIIYLMLIFFFNYPIMFFGDKGVIETLKLSRQFFNKNKEYVVVWLLILVGISIGVFIVTIIFNFIPLLGQVINFVINIALVVWNSLILFNSYKARLKG